VLAPIGAVKDTAELAMLGYNLVNPKRRSIRRACDRVQFVLGGIARSRARFRRPEARRIAA
jgi:hypothetical protein